MDGGQQNVNLNKLHRVLFSLCFFKANLHSIIYNIIMTVHFLSVEENKIDIGQ